MRVDISKITNAVNKISDLVSGDKSVPGVMFDLSEGLLKVCYTDGHKSLIEELEVENEEGDKLGRVVVSYEQLSRALANCQPSGNIKIDKCQFKYADNIIKLSADQMYDLQDNEGNVVATKRLATKNMDLLAMDPSANMKSAILTRMKYEDIFDADTTDVFDRKELIEALSKTSVEKNRVIYISNKVQSVFVSNQVHLTSVPMSKHEISEEKLAEIKEELESQGNFNDETYKELTEKERNRIHFSVAMSYQISKALIGILGKIKSDVVYLHTKDKFCSIFVENEDETVGVWFEMATANRININTLERFNSLKYTNSQLVFLKEFLADIVKSALNIAKSEKTTFQFNKNDEGLLELELSAGSASASVSDKYAVVCEDVLDPNENLTGKKFNISLKIMHEMLNQIKTRRVAFDLDVTEDGTTFLRIAEVNDVKMAEEYMKARQKTEALCREQGIAFDPNSTPTPAELKFEYRGAILDTKQYTMLAK